jgi:hypothetical protein
MEQNSSVYIRPAEKKLIGESDPAKQNSSGYQTSGARPYGTDSRKIYPNLS